MKQKTIIITGGSGYVGEELIFQLLKKGYKVANIDKKKPTVNNKATFYKHNLLNPTGLAKLLKNGDICIHLAAEVGGVSFANKYPAKIISNNSLIDINIINAAKNAGIKKIIYISTSIVYEKSNNFPLKENQTDSLPSPDLSYGFEKLFGENLCKAAEREYGLKFSICRLFNVYGIGSNGIGDPNGHVIPDLITKVKKSKEKIELWGGKGITRSFTHVSDIASGIIAVMESKKAENQIFNIGNSKEYSLEEIIKILWKLMKKKGVVKFKYKPTKFQDVKRSFADTGKAKKLLNWDAKIKMEEGLKGML